MSEVICPQPTRVVAKAEPAIPVSSYYQQEVRRWENNMWKATFQELEHELLTSDQLTLARLIQICKLQRRGLSISIMFHGWEPDGFVESLVSRLAVMLGEKDGIIFFPVQGWQPSGIFLPDHVWQLNTEKAQEGYSKLPASVAYFPGMSPIEVEQARLKYWSDNHVVIRESVYTMDILKGYLMDLVRPTPYIYMEDANGILTLWKGDKQE